MATQKIEYVQYLKYCLHICMVLINVMFKLQHHFIVIYVLLTCYLVKRLIVDGLEIEVLRKGNQTNGGFNFRPMKWVRVMVFNATFNNI